MSENQSQPIEKSTDTIEEQLQDSQQYIKEIKLQHCFDALILAGLVVVVFQTFSYLLYGAINTDLDATLYMFSLLIGPAAFFLLLLHLYELHGFVKRGEKSIPLTLDLMYFIYLAIAFTTMIGLHSYYQQHDIPQKFLTTGWVVGVLMLCGEVLLALLFAKILVTLFISPRLPHFFEHRSKEPHVQPLPLQRRSFKPNQIYYFRKKPDVNVWQNNENFVKYKHV
jgi:FtsH-binding integral membrane protein